MRRKGKKTSKAFLVDKTRKLVRQNPIRFRDAFVLRSLAEQAEQKNQVSCLY